MKKLQLPKPFFVLATMDDVTDTVFQQIIDSCASADLYITEFVNVDGLQSPGRKNLLKKLQFTAKEKPIIAQLWGKEPENYFKTAKQIADGSLAAEANNLQVNDNSKHSGLSDMQGNNEQRINRTNGTESKQHRQLTQQITKSGSSVFGSAKKQADTTSMFA